jgi:hypothetical protein
MGASIGNFRLLPTNMWQKHWGAMTIAVRWAIESDVGHRARKNLELFFGARNALTDGFAARLCCLDDR